jgi:glycosyltransferase involved in cell wall biosynthesis
MSQLCLNILVPGLSGPWRCGGLSQLIKTASLNLSLKTRLVTYIDREDGYPFLSDLPYSDSDFFLVGWGPDISYLSGKLPEDKIIVNSHSFFKSAAPPDRCPVICTSRYTLSQWARLQSARPLYVVPDVIEDQFVNQNRDRPIDVLVFDRKISPYLRDILIPELRNRCEVFSVSSYVEDLAALYNRSKVLLYDSRWHFSCYSSEEGFGLHPLEARACGCSVFTSFNGALSQYFGVAGFYQIHVNDSQHDVRAIQKVIASGAPEDIDLGPYRESSVTKLWSETLESCVAFLQTTQHNKSELKKVKKLNHLAFCRNYSQRALRRIRHFSRATRNHR